MHMFLSAASWICSCTVAWCLIGNTSSRYSNTLASLHELAYSSNVVIVDTLRTPNTKILFSEFLIAYSSFTFLGVTVSDVCIWDWLKEGEVLGLTFSPLIDSTPYWCTSFQCCTTHCTVYSKDEVYTNRGYKMDCDAMIPTCVFACYCALDKLTYERN